MYVYICLLNRGILKQDLKQGDTFYIDFCSFLCIGHIYK